MGGTSLPPKRKPAKKADPEKVFSGEILASIQALGRDVWQHSFDNVGKVVPGHAARRPADRELTYLGTHIILELKATRKPTLCYSALKLHQVKTLLKVTRAGGHGLVLVKQVLARPRCWVITSALLEERELDIGVRGSFALEELVEVTRLPDPRGWQGCVWDLKTLFDGLKISQDTSEVKDG